MTHLITAIYRDPSQAAVAVDRLVDLGVSPKSISVLTSEDVDHAGFAVETHTHVAEGAAIGAGAGGAIGALIADFTSVGAIATGGIGLLVAGPLVAALAGAGAGAASGGLIGALVGLGVPEHEAKFYEGEIEKGGILLGVHAASDEESLVKDILRDTDGRQVVKN